MDRYWQLLGIKIYPHKGAKFWLSVMNAIQNHELKDILIPCIDSFLVSLIHNHISLGKLMWLCIVYMVRKSIAFVNWQKYKQICADFEAIYIAATESTNEFYVEILSEKWYELYQSIIKC